MFELYSGDDLPSSGFACLLWERDQGNMIPYTGYFFEKIGKWCLFDTDEQFDPYEIAAWCRIDDPRTEARIEEIDADSEGKARADEEHLLALQSEPEYNSER